MKINDKHSFFTRCTCISRPDYTGSWFYARLCRDNPDCSEDDTIKNIIPNEVSYITKCEEFKGSFFTIFAID